jgi:hypothetical protein
MGLFKQLMESEIKKSLNEVEIIEPSEQIIKAMMKVLKLKTGIIATVTVDQAKANVITYTADLSKEILPELLMCLVQKIVFCEFTFKKNNVSVSEKNSFLIIVKGFKSKNSCQI